MIFMHYLIMYFEIMYFHCETFQISPSQLQKFRAQLVFFIGVLPDRQLVGALAQLVAHQVLFDLEDKGSDKGRQVGAAAAEREDVVLLLLLGVRYRQFGHLVQHSGQGHAQGRGLTVAQAQQH